MQKTIMNLKHQTLAKALTYSGTLPVIGCVFLSLLGVTNFDAAFIALTYCAVIIAFLSGIHWAAYLFLSQKCPYNLLVISNVFALAAWASLFIPATWMACALQSVYLLCLLYVDRKLHSSGILPTWFYLLRRNATIIVVFSLSILAILERT